MIEGVPGYLKYRVLDTSGNVVIADLPHLHQSQWTVEGYQAGSKGLGHFQIPLYPPNATSEYALAKRDYDKLDENYRVEGYLGDVISGAPRFSGVIREFSRRRESFVIGGYDSILAAEAQQVFPGESVNGTTYDVFNQYLGRNLLSYGDDFSTGSLSGYTQVSGTWTLGSDGYGSYVTTNGSSERYIYTNSSWANSVYQPLHVLKVIGSIALDAATVALHAFLGFVGGNGDSWVGGQVNVNTNGTVDAFIYTRSSGVYTAQASAINIFPSYTVTATNSPLLVEIQLIGYYTISGGVASNLVYHLLVNGKDVCQWSYGNPAGISGNIGVRQAGGGAGSTVKVYELTFKSRAAVGHQTPLAFQQGSTLSGANGTTQRIAQIWSGQTFLDIWNTCAATEGWEYRKTPAAGANADQIDFGSALGTDYSVDGQVRFVEDENLVDIDEESNLELFSSSLRFSTASGPNSVGGTIVYDNLTAINKYGIWDDTDQNLGVSDFSIARGYAKRASLLRGTPRQGKTVTVVRDPRTADAFRELDYIEVHAPSRNYDHAKMRVLGYTFTEGSPQMTLVCDQYPINQRRALTRVTRRIRDNLQTVGNQFANR